MAANDQALQTQSRVSSNSGNNSSGSRRSSLSDNQTISPSDTDNIKSGCFMDTDSPQTEPEFQASKPAKARTSLDTDDETTLAILDPSWLKQCPEHQCKDKFLHCVLPQLVSKGNDWSSFLNDEHHQPLELPENSWVNLFRQTTFELHQAVTEYELSPLKKILGISRYLTIERRVRVYTFVANLRRILLAGTCLWRAEERHRVGGVILQARNSTGGTC